jgi:hypothetical protein
MLGFVRPATTALVLGCTALLASCETAGGRETARSAACPVSHTELAQSPPIRSSSPTTTDWYINVNRTIWAGWLGQDGALRWSNGGAYKTYWIRPVGSDLTVSGRRLDGPVETLKAEVPAGYDSEFQIVGIRFPSAGCWEVTASAGDETLQFILELIQN